MSEIGDSEKLENICITGLCLCLVLDLSPPTKSRQLGKYRAGRIRFRIPLRCSWGENPHPSRAQISPIGCFECSAFGTFSDIYAKEVASLYSQKYNKIVSGWGRMGGLIDIGKLTGPCKLE